jgi:NTE family protein
LGSLGAFEAGIYQALHEADILPDWIAGTSIGAINAALIAGNAPGKRIARLRSFWERISHGSTGSVAASGEARRVANFIASLRARVAGRPGLYAPTLPRFFFDLPGWGQPWLYHYGPAMVTLGELIDFDRLASGEPRLTLNVTDLATGEVVLLDNSNRRLTLNTSSRAPPSCLNSRRSRSPGGSCVTAATRPTSRSMPCSVSRRRGTRSA